MMDSYAQAIAACVTELRDKTGVTLPDTGFTLTDWQLAYLKPVADKMVKHQRRHGAGWAAAYQHALNSSDGSDGSRNRSH